MNITKIITEPPKRSGIKNTPDGALSGNGDIAIILGNSGNGMRIHMAKCDMWRGCEIHDIGGLRPIGYMDIDIPNELYRHYAVEQRMAAGELFGSFQEGASFFEIKAFASALSNHIFLELRYSADISPKEPLLIPRAWEAEITELCDIEGIHGFVKSFVGNELAFETHCASAIKPLKKEAGYALYMVCIYTNHDDAHYRERTVKELTAYTYQDFLEEYEQHLAWWKHFWSASDMRLNDPELELNWHASQYFLAICARSKTFAPGIFGNFITNDKPAWKGDYHLNYNYQAPFYHLCSSNHIELTDCYSIPLEEFMERGKKFSKEFFGTKGTYFPIALGPKGTVTEYPQGEFFHERLDLGQRSNAAHAANIMIFRWYATRDIQYAKDHLYPYIKEVGEFWESYLVKEGDRYVILNDAIHEVPCYVFDFLETKEKYEHLFHDKNSLLSLGLVRMLFRALLDVSNALGVDLDKHPLWQDILENLSEYPTFIKDGKKVFRYTEQGLEWNDRNSLCLQHCYPASQIGLGSDPDLLEIARNTFFATDRWFDDNATNSVFPIAARLGIDPKLILEKLRENYRRFQLPNLLLFHKGGCLENCSLTAATLNEMVLQSYENIIRIFPVWDKDLDCEYENLRADGAFLVSAGMKNGTIENIRIVSEKGSDLVLQNPYERCIVSLNGTRYIFDEKIIRLKTSPNDDILIHRV